MKYLIVILILFISFNAFALEKDYQRSWCNSQNGDIEYYLLDKTRVDCLLNDYAIEFDYAHKWAEAIGQSLYYAGMTGKKPGVVLIMRKNDKKYLKRLNKVAEKYNIKVWTIDE